MKKICFLIFISFGISHLNAQLSGEQYQEDFLFAWEQIGNNYAYFNKKTTDWERVKTHYLKEAAEVKSNHDFTLFMEKVLLELYDSHTFLLTNTSDSYRLYSSGTDLVGKLIDDVFLIMAVRDGTEAKTKIFPGDKIVMIDEIIVSEAIKKYIGKTVDTQDPAVKNYAFNLLLAGDYKNDRNITLLRKGKKMTFNLGVFKLPESQNNLMQVRMLDNNIAYVKINNSLGNNSLIELFDHEIDKLDTTEGLILDLRDTSWGGNSLVGRAVLSKFVEKETPYQKHELHYDEKYFGIKRSWVELVSPRGKIYTKPMVVLVNYWTASMGEGLAIAFDGINRATVVGTEMAKLLGSNYTIHLPNVEFNMNYVAERLYHIDNTPREEFLPPVLVNLFEEKQGEDLILKKGILALKKQIKLQPQE